MRKIISAAVGSAVAFVILALVAPAAQAQVPPEPSAPETIPTAAVDAGVSLLSWQTAIVAVVAVAIGAAVALAIGHYARRGHAAGLAAA